MNIQDIEDLNDLLNFLNIIFDEWEPATTQFDIAIGWHNATKQVKAVIAEEGTEPAAYDSRYNHSHLSVVELVSDLTEALSEGYHVSVRLRPEVREKYLRTHETCGVEPKVEVSRRGIEREFDFSGTEQVW